MLGDDALIVDVYQVMIQNIETVEITVENIKICTKLQNGYQNGISHIYKVLKDQYLEYYKVRVTVLKE